MKYILSLIVTLISLSLAQQSNAPALSTNLSFNGSGTAVVSKFYTDAPFLVDISSSGETQLSLFSAENGQKIMDFVPGQLVQHTGEFFFIVHSPATNTSWQIKVENPSYQSNLNQAEQTSSLQSETSSAQVNNIQATNYASSNLANGLAFEGQGSNSTTEFYADRPFQVNFNQDSGVRLYLYSGPNQISVIQPGQTIGYSGQFYIYVNSPNQNTPWRIDLSQIN